MLNFRSLRENPLPGTMTPAAPGLPGWGGKRGPSRVFHWSCHRKKVIFTPWIFGNTLLVYRSFSWIPPHGFFCMLISHRFLQGQSFLRKKSQSLFVLVLTIDFFWCPIWLWYRFALARMPFLYSKRNWFHWQTMQTGPAECMEFVGEHEDEDCTNDVDSTSNKPGFCYQY
jgi:hypothetical protein